MVRSGGKSTRVIRRRLIALVVLLTLAQVATPSTPAFVIGRLGRSIPARLYASADN